MTEHVGGHTAELSPVEALNQFTPSNYQTSQMHKVALSVLRFGIRLGDIGLLFEAGVFSQVIEDIAVSKIPLTPNWFSGIANMRGNLLPVFDLNYFLNIAPKTTSTSSKTIPSNTHKVLMLDKGQYRAGILIEALPQLVNTDTPQRNLPPLPEQLSNFVTRAYFDHQEIWLSFDHRAFFTAIGGQLARID